MNKADVHRAWARPEGRWSAWVKPILFATLGEDLVPEPLGPPPAWLVLGVLEPLVAAAGGGASYRRASDPLAGTAFVVDLPGAEGALVGVALAAHGFAPVPLYNALWEEHALVDVGPIRRALVDGAPAVRDVPDDAPPAFLLDADRHGPASPVPSGGDFDNRSFCAPTDFPSADALLSAGIRRVVLLQRHLPSPAADLAPVLLDWKRRGLALLLACPDPLRPPAPLVRLRPPVWTRLGHWLSRAVFRRRADGAFGERLPVTSVS